MTDQTYFLKTGEADRLRLTILSKIYNPFAQQFILSQGLDKGMTVLEVGCGTGHMACWLAQHVGEKGKVIALDNSQAQIDIARETAKERGVDNIEFICHDVTRLHELNLSYDFTYGRWVLFFTQAPESALQQIYDGLNTGGVLTYETLTPEQHCAFACPPFPEQEKWHDYCIENFKASGLDTTFGFKMPTLLKQFGAKKVVIKTHQPILTTAEEKKVYRLGLITTKDIGIERGLFTEQEYNSVVKRFEQFEQDEDAIAAGFRNILVAGYKC